MDYVILIGMMTVCIGAIGLVYCAATAQDVPEITVGLYAVQVKDYHEQKLTWCTVFKGSLTACSEERVRLFQQGHTRATARIVQLI